MHHPSRVRPASVPSKDHRPPETVFTGSGPPILSPVPCCAVLPRAEEVDGVRPRIVGARPARRLAGVGGGV